MKYKYRLLIVLLACCVSACKKEAAAPASSGTITGKWYSSYRSSKFYYQGAVVDSSSNSKFTSNDFVQYYSDGSGIISEDNTPSPSLFAFRYTINGLNMVQFNSVTDVGIPETITKLTTSNLTIHYTLQVTDAATGEMQTEVDDYSFTR